MRGAGRRSPLAPASSQMTIVQFDRSTISAPTAGTSSPSLIRSSTFGFPSVLAKVERPGDGSSRLSSQSRVHARGRNAECAQFRTFAAANRAWISAISAAMSSSLLVSSEPLIFTSDELSLAL
jgi:hypothetical protein